MIDLKTLNDGYVKESIAIGKRDASNFTQSIVKEVDGYSKKNKRKILSITQSILAMMFPIIAIPKSAGANSVIDINYESDLIPSEISVILTQLINGAGKIGILLAILLLIIAGCLKMAGQSEKARRWSVEIIKGFGQILLAPLIVMLLVLITRLLLGNVEGLRPFF